MTMHFLPSFLRDATLRRMGLALLSVLALACSSGPGGSPTVVPPSLPAEASAPEFPRLDPSTVLTRVGFGSCLGQDGEQPILDVVRRRDFDLFLMLGDNVYGDVSDPTEMTELRQAYAKQASNPGFDALRRSTPMLAVWDDHDFGLNDAGATFPGRSSAEELFDQFWRIPDDAASRTWPGIYDAHVFGPEGQRTQVLLLDTRFFRSDLETSTDDNWRYNPDPDPGKTMLGEEQWKWLEAELRKPADLRLLVSSIQVLAEGHGWEAWRTLPRERDRLYAVIRRTGAEGVVVLSGDRHRAGIYRRDDVVGYPLHEITSSSLNRPSDSPEEPGPYRLGPSYRPENFGVIQIDWGARSVRLEVADLEGEIVLDETIDLETLRPLGSSRDSSAEAGLPASTESEAQPF